MGVIRNNDKNLYESNDQCLSILRTMKGVKSGIDIVMSECLKDGFSQKFYFDECGAKYESPLLKYVRNQDRNLCVGFCDDYRPCLQSCNETDGNIVTYLSL